MSTGTANFLEKTSDVIDKSNLPTLDKIRSTLDHAAEVLRESLEITAGGVVFLDTTVRYLVDENASRRDPADKYRLSKVQAMSTASISEWVGAPDGKTLQSLIGSYPYVLQNFGHVIDLL